MESCITGFICTRIRTPVELKILMKNVEGLKMVMPSKEEIKKKKRCMHLQIFMKLSKQELPFTSSSSVTQEFLGSPRPSIDLSQMT